uniref:hypothetical protein n=1 Tax=Pedobacter schmidteae TaxID=2201271 RepID=UPI000EAB57D9|nr:hypothetical protein [Pedobacter schmidteae]
MSLSFLNINRLEDYHRDPRLQSVFCSRLLWRDHGEYMVFVPSGLPFDMDQYAAGGWILSFNERFVQNFLSRYPQDYNNALLVDKSQDQVFVPMNAKLRSEMNELAEFLRKALTEGQSELFTQIHTDLILLNANQTHVGMYSK